MKVLSPHIAVMHNESESARHKAFFRVLNDTAKLSRWLLASGFTAPLCANTTFTYNPLEKRRERVFNFQHLARGSAANISALHRKNAFE
ncbi:hypothetical protein [Paraburkholderia sp. HD33-4]|uniref:hypothetical protein n=1 Tax=Paraburkholderia sp. HD33-4 TaxID=2883242 RepID=UPI001F2D60C9|nr:hypothetical protein [Paraburkholderia sp. HD33-4]